MSASFDSDGANVNDRPDNRNDNLGVSFSRVFPAYEAGVFRVLDPTANHATDFDDLFGERSNRYR